MLSWLLSLLLPFLFIGGATPTPATMPAHTATADNADDKPWDTLSHSEYVKEYEDEFTELFQGYETKWSKNNRLMIRTGDSGPYKFVKKGA